MSERAHLKAYGPVQTILKSQDLDIMMGLLAPQPKGPAPARSAGEQRDMDAGQLASLIRAARKGFERRGANEDAVAAAIMTVIAGAWTDSRIASLARRAAAEAASAETLGAPPPEKQEPHLGKQDAAAHIFYGLAAQEFSAGKMQRAAVLLATLLHWDMDDAEALSSLAVCAASLGKLDEAMLLASECLKLPQKHPRAYCLAGLCELERGNRKAAQSLLALAARLARTRPEFRKDLQAAQRLLLILHFA
jgi:Flp pilus assembly protein TadD